MKKGIYLLLASILLLFLTACDKKLAFSHDEDTKNISTSDTFASTNNTEAKKTLSSEGVLLIFERFLDGKAEATNKSGNKTNIQDYLRSDYNKYAVYDMNGDAVDELILKTGNGLTIFWVTEQGLTVWYNGTVYAKPLNNRTILYERPGGAPVHTDYQYIILDYTGEELLKISFSEYYGGDDPLFFQHFGSNELYLINEQQVSKTIYENLCKTPILSIADDAIEWQDIPHT